VKHGLLFFNTHSRKEVDDLRVKLEQIEASQPNLATIGFVGLGNERCNNTWLEAYVTARHPFEVRFVFLVYGLANGKEFHNPPFFQFPLGPALYRRFPTPKYHPSLAGPAHAQRLYLCNFLGTVYNNSIARNSVKSILMDPANSHWNCYLKDRTRWRGKELEGSMAEYVSILRESDYTLCPPGFNVEAYRIYEAMTFGSVPILQYGVKRMTGDLQDDKYKCADSFRLLKEHNAPVIWLDDWSELTDVLNRLQAETPEQTYQRR
jgi:hypothetical protein